MDASAAFEAEWSPEGWRPWVRPPRTVVPVAVPEDGLLGRNGTVVVSLLGVLAYPCGVAFRVHAVARWRGDTAAPWMPTREPPPRGLGRFLRKRHENDPWAPRPGSGSVGIEYPDGTSRQCSLDRFDPRADPPGRTPAPPVLRPMGGSSGGSDRSWTMERGLWLWPLPPPEPFALVVAWPSLGLEPARREIDGATIVAAAARAEPAWPAD